MRRRRTFTVAALLAVTIVTVTAVTRDSNREATAQAAADAAGGASSTQATMEASTATPEKATAALPGPRVLGDVAALGPETLKTVPLKTTKAVVVRGDSPTSTMATIELYELTSGAWERVGRWRGHLGAKGWTTNHKEGDLRTPVGTYTLSDAGGRLKDPGTKLPYYHSKSFVPGGSSVFGDSLAGSFDYVIAIDFNRRTGVSPLDPAHPDGDARGGGIWLHVDHDGPTHGCVSVPRAGMQALLRALSPSDHPIVIMGDKARLAA